ncbi:carboxymuconolactone decarboxylase family protein [Salinifilum ghardaiensis]
MVDFPIHNESTAPQEVASALADTRKNLGMIPNLHGIFAESPQAYHAYQALTEQFRNTSLSTTAQHVVLLTASRQNSCHYCMAAHTALAKQAGADEAIIDAIREDKPVPDESAEAVRRFTQAVVTHRGLVPEDDTAHFLAAGFTRRQILDVVLGVTMKTLSNYTNHFAETPVDEAFQEHAWNV